MLVLDKHPEECSWLCIFSQNSLFLCEGEILLEVAGSFLLVVFLLFSMKAKTPVLLK